MVVPRGWTLDDRREASPRLFRSTPADPSAPRARTKRTPPAEPPADQLVLETDERTVADVAGAHDSDDPDATLAIPWMPDFDQQDDLDGVLAACSPLLAARVPRHRQTALTGPMHTTVTLFIDGAALTDLFAQVATLDRYPAWMRMVHRVEPLEPDDGRPAWRVELRARIGPFARSKQLRMVRTQYEPDRHVRFERVQDDVRDHAEWILTALVDEAEGGASLTTELTYTGRLWGSAVLERALDEEIRRGKVALSELVSAEPTR